MFRLTLFLALTLMCFGSTSQEVDQRAFDAYRIEGVVKVDGQLDETEWHLKPFQGDFVRHRPTFGGAPEESTSIQVMYDDAALYVGAVLVDTSSKGTSYALSQRDDEGNADHFAIYIDPFRSGRASFEFGVTATGVQFDGYGGGRNWDAVWASRVIRTDSSWQVEMRIPYSAFRFPDKEVQQWNINFYRHVRRKRETSTWNPVDPGARSSLMQMGRLDGVENVKPPLRLFLTPFVSGYLEHFPNETPGVDDWSESLNAGMDLKYGINESFTLDMTLIPDFGQVKFDDQIRNLSPYEVYFNENRPFFMEGLEYFSQGNVFYSRRVGGAPVDPARAYEGLDDARGEEVVSLPGQTSLYNAFKLSGRTSKGTGLAVFNAVTANSWAVVRDSFSNEREVKISPLTNYNMMVFDQNLKNNSSVSVYNTNVLRDGSYMDANVSGAAFNLLNQKQSYSLGGRLNVSNRYGAESENTTGYHYSIGVGKVSGKWRGSVNYTEINDTYDPNDLGYLGRNNFREARYDMRYSLLNPYKKFLNGFMRFATIHRRLAFPDTHEATWFEYQALGTFRNFMSMSASATYTPFGSNDFFEPRVAGRVYHRPANWSVGYWLSSDYNKLFSMDAGVNYTKLMVPGRYEASFSLSPRFRLGDRGLLVYDFSYAYRHRDEGYVADGSWNTDLEPDQIILGKRQVHTITNVLETQLIFTNRMGMDLKVRHFWNVLDYSSFHELDQEGGLQYADLAWFEEDGSTMWDETFNAFTVDLNFRWIFLPGSELNLNWKNGIFSSFGRSQLKVKDNLKYLFNEPMTNSISLKVLYHFDVLYIKQWRDNARRRKERKAGADLG